MAYFIRAALINEMTSPDWDQPVGNGLTLGEEALMSRYGAWVGEGGGLG